MSQISVIVPVYKVDQYLQRCVDSILAQTFTDYELILIDDGSSDNSGSICDEYLMTDERVIAVHMVNGGVSAARNRGIVFSQGDFISFIDSDDWVESGYLEMYYTHQTDLTLSGHNTYDESDRLISLLNYSEAYYTQKDEIDYVNICDKLFSPYCRLFRRSIIIENNIRFPVDISWGEDGVFGSEYFIHTRSMCILPENVYHYIDHNTKTSLASKLRLDIVDMITVSREIYLHNITAASNANHDIIEKKIINDLMYNCSYFVRRVFSDSNTFKNKICMLKRFYGNKYVQKTIILKNNYYYGNMRIAITRHPLTSLIRYNMLEFITCCSKIPTKLYGRLPESIKKKYRNIKRRIKNDS